MSNIFRNSVQNFRDLRRSTLSLNTPLSGSTLSLPPQVYEEQKRVKSHIVEKPQLYQSLGKLPTIEDLRRKIENEKEERWEKHLNFIRRYEESKNKYSQQIRHTIPQIDSPLVESEDESQEQESVKRTYSSAPDLSDTLETVPLPRMPKYGSNVLSLVHEYEAKSKQSIPEIPPKSYRLTHRPVSPKHISERGVRSSVLWTEKEKEEFHQDAFNMLQLVAKDELSNVPEKMQKFFHCYLSYLTTTAQIMSGTFFRTCEKFVMNEQRDLLARYSVDLSRWTTQEINLLKSIQGEKIL